MNNWLLEGRQCFRADLQEFGGERAGVECQGGSGRQVGDQIVKLQLEW